MKALVVQFISACAITWACVLALGLSSCTFMDQDKALTAIQGNKSIKIEKSVRMPASLETKGMRG